MNSLSPMEVMAEIREEQRGAIQRSMLYTSGARFNANDTARVLSVKRAAAAHVLEGMVEDGLIVKHVGANKKIAYSVKGVNWLARSWRNVSNEELHIKSNRLGGY